MKPGVAIEIDDVGEHLESIGGAFAQQLFRLSLQQQDGRREGVVLQSDFGVDPRFERRTLVRFSNGAPVTVAPMQDLLSGSAGTALAAFVSAADQETFVAEPKLKLDTESFAFFVDQFAGIFGAAAMPAEQGVGQPIEDGRLTAAIGPGQHPEWGVGKLQRLLIAKREKATELDAARNHEFYERSHIIDPAKARMASRSSSGSFTSSTSK